MVLEVVGAERDARHLDRVAGPLRGGDRAHERLVAVAHVRVDHVEVALVDRDVDRLADRAAAVVEVRRGVGQLHEVAEVLDGAVAPAAVEVAHERRAVVRGEDRVHPADLDVVPASFRAYWVNWRGARRLDDRAAHPAREADPLAVDVGARLPQQPERVRVAAEVDADLLEDRVGVLLDQREALLAEDLERRERARQEGRPLGVGLQSRGAGGPRGRPPPRGASSAHRSSPVARPPRPVVAAARARVGRRAGGRGRSRQRHDPLEVRVGRPVRDRHRLDEVLLEARLDRGLDLLDPADDALDLAPRRARQQGDERARPGRVAGRPDVAGSQSGISPRIIAWSGSIWLPNAPASRTSSTASIRAGPSAA